ncbi:hypothetical protein GCM10011488_30460 [Steroidobacter agaridevorans]|nr:hypothetical protein GCM10011488_30460 [Steroidobacter agaridevorans]
MTLIVARAARQAAISANVSDWFESTNTNAEEPHTQPAMPEAAAKRQPHELDAVARSSACRKPVVSTRLPTCTSRVAIDQPTIRV